MLERKLPKNIQAFMTTCKKYNLRITPQRLTLYKKIITMSEHPTVDELFRNIQDELPTVSFDTVHRTLMTFARIGLLAVVEGQGSPRRYDPNLHPHHHLHCVHCGDIIDYYHRGYDDLKIPEVIHDKYKVLSQRVVINIICPDCQSSDETL
ncbi:Fur family transcriptional regulator [candidate division CSSED10-310 bacterium]|uniref:Fur family transcriptional regulator n=1 Tax=candidate division CSSED10-310 bacterium TaxID=2855610 RepID=A0ABV6YZA2_UNCC1